MSVARSKTQITKRVLDAAKRLLTIGAFCIGTEQIDTDYAATHGVATFNVRFNRLCNSASAHSPSLVLCVVTVLQHSLSG